uniref:Uncharacterized protein n=1 Tax=Alexandrium monilatum TaxID=311494 RepID=A0A7S4QAX9_9DINO
MPSSAGRLSRSSSALAGGLSLVHAADELADGHLPPEAPDLLSVSRRCASCEWPRSRPPTATTEGHVHLARGLAQYIALAEGLVHLAGGHAQPVSTPRAEGLVHLARGPAQSGQGSKILQPRRCSHGRPDPAQKDASFPAEPSGLGSRAPPRRGAFGVPPAARSGLVLHKRCPAEQWSAHRSPRITTDSHAAAVDSRG